MIVFPARRSVALKAATALSRVATLAMFVRTRPSRARRTISLSWARSGTTTKSIARTSAGGAARRLLGGPGGRHPRSPAEKPAPTPLRDAAAEDVETQIDPADIF